MDDWEAIDIVVQGGDMRPTQRDAALAAMNRLQAPHAEDGATIRAAADGMRRAGKTIAELRAENERLREQVTPVLFSEREPEDATEILIWNRISYRWEYRMWWHLPDDVRQYQGFTYWLPEPPPPDDSLVVV